ncbi:MAG: hypothetical protein E7317_12015, partial [Clostridiales bacterium]|nr:hypothetical protein [Clostridiales bacterium]
TPEEVVMPVSAPNVSINANSYSEDGQRYLTGSTATFSWTASGDVREYRIYMRSDNGTRTQTDQTIGTSKKVNLSSLAPGQYRLYVGAVPVNMQSEDDIAWSSVSFSIPAQIEADDDPNKEEEFDVPLDPVEGASTDTEQQNANGEAQFGDAAQGDVPELDVPVSALGGDTAAGGIEDVEFGSVIAAAEAVSGEPMLAESLPHAEEEAPTAEADVQL